MKIYYCGKEDCTPGHFFGPAVRTHYLLHFILEGQGIYKTSGEIYQVSEDEAFLICPGEVTYYEAHEVTPWRYAWVAFDGPDAESLLEERGLTEHHLVCKVDTAKTRTIKQLMLEIISVFEKPMCDEKELLGYFYLIIACLEKSEKKRGSDYEKGYLEKAMDYMHHNYSYNININDVARHIGINRSYLYRIFMLYKKVPPKQYLTEYRLLVAKDMLEKTDYTITEIALSAGFLDSSSFCKAFQRSERVTPLRFRKMKRNLGTPCE